MVIYAISYSTKQLIKNTKKLLSKGTGLVSSAVEHPAVNRKVEGSIPSLSAMTKLE